MLVRTKVGERVGLGWRMQTINKPDIAESGFWLQF